MGCLTDGKAYGPKSSVISLAMALIFFSYAPPVVGVCAAACTDTRCSLPRSTHRVHGHWSVLCSPDRRNRRDKRKHSKTQTRRQQAHGATEQERKSLQARLEAKRGRGAPRGSSGGRRVCRLSAVDAVPAYSVQTYGPAAQFRRVG